MAFPATAQDLAVELHLGGNWVDVTGDVREDSGINISRGQSSEGAQAQPSTCSLVLDNQTGNYSPRKPNGIYFSSIGRNTPLRVSLGDTAEDAFGRTVSNGWGSADLGGAWTTSGGVAGDYAVASGVGTHAVTAAATSRLTYLNGLSLGDVDVVVTVSLAVTNITGAPAEPANIALRGSGSDYVMVRLQIETDESVKIGILTAAGAVLVAPATVTGLTHTSAQALRVRAVAEGQTVKARVWAASGSEPATWHATATGTTAQVPAAGYVGVRSGLATGNTNAPLTFSYDNFEVRRPRFAGEVSDWPVHSDVSGTDITVSIEASGVLRRLEQGSSPLKSAYRRAILAQTEFPPHAYWPMEDGANATEFGSAVAGPPLEIRGDIDPASGTTFSCSDSLPVFGPGVGSVAGAVDPYTAGSEVWSLALVRVPTGGVAGSGYPLMVLQMRGSGVLLWSAQLNPAGDLRLQAATANNVIVADSTFTGTIAMNNVPSVVYIQLTQVGGDIQWNLGQTTANEALVGTSVSGTLVGYTLGTVFSVTLGADAISLNGVEIGHVMVANGLDGDADVLGAPLVAHTGETAVARISRLADEETLGAAVIVGDAADSERAGVQTIDTIVNLLVAAATADVRYIYEPRGSLGVAHRTRASLYNQAAALTLNYATNQLQPHWDVVDDDRHLRNEVTVKRDGGAEVTYSSPSGPLTVDAVGRYDEAVTVTLYRDNQVRPQAQWRVHLGTIDEPRYPRVEVNLAKNTSLRSAVLAVDIGSRIVITNPPNWLPPENISVVVQGYTEHLSRFDHTLVFNGVPESAYHVYAVEDSTYGRLDSEDTTLAVGVNSSIGSLSVAIATGGALWTTTAGDWPFGVMVGGERMTVTDVSGSASPQTFTVTRSVNGVVKSHSAGAQVRLADPAVLAL